MTAPKRRGRPKSTKNANGLGSAYYDKSSGLYVQAITIGHNEDGKPIRKKVTGKTQEIVAEKAAKMRGDAKVIDLTTPDPTVAQLAEQYLTWFRNSKRDVSSKTTREPTIRLHIIDNATIGSINARACTKGQVEAWLYGVCEKGYTVKGERRPYSERYVLDLIGYLSTIFNWAMEDGRNIVGRNPTRNVEVPDGTTEASDEKRALPEDVAVRLMHRASTTGMRYGCYILALITLGARPGEIAGLRWEDIEWDTGIVWIRKALKRRNGGVPVALGEPKTSRAAKRAGRRDKAKRPLEVTDKLLHALKREHDVQEELRAAAGPLWSTEWEGLVFLGQLGKPPNASNLRRSMRALMESDPMLKPYADFTLYELRHSVASILAERGTPLHEISDQLGHTDTRMVDRNYRHRSDPTIATARNVWAQIEKEQKRKRPKEDR